MLVCLILPDNLLIIYQLIRISCKGLEMNHAGHICDMFFSQSAVHLKQAVNGDTLNSERLNDI